MSGLNVLLKHLWEDFFSHPWMKNMVKRKDCAIKDVAAGQNVPHFWLKIEPLKHPGPEKVHPPPPASSAPPASPRSDSRCQAATSESAPLLV